MKMAGATIALVFSLFVNQAATQPISFDERGVLIQGTICVLFQADSGGLFFLDNLGGFQVGDRVRVIGDLDPTCATICQQQNGCIRNNVISEDVDDPFATDHFKCYKVSLEEPPQGQFRGKNQPGLEDQFEQESTKVLRPVLLCNPVDKNGEGIKNAADHLICYKTRSQDKPQFEQRGVLVHNQFGAQRLKVRNRDNLLCVPSLKSESP